MTKFHGDQFPSFQIDDIAPHLFRENQLVRNLPRESRLPRSVERLRRVTIGRPGVTKTSQRRTAGPAAFLAEPAVFSLLATRPPPTRLPAPPSQPFGSRRSRPSGAKALARDCCRPRWSWRPSALL